MFILIATLFASVIVALVAARKGVNGAKAATVILSIAAVIATVVNFFIHGGTTTVEKQFADEERAARALGEIIGREIPSGKILVLRAAPSKQYIATELTQRRFDGLKQAFKNAEARFIQAGPQYSGITSDDPAYTQFTQDGFEQELQAWFAGQHDIKAIVSLLPLPPAFRSEQAPLYAFFAGRDQTWADGLKNGLIKAAILYRYPHPPAGAPATADGLPATYLLVTPANLDDAIKTQRHF